MELQRVFKHSYMDYLRRHIHIEDYQQEQFPYDESKTKHLANVYHPEGLLDKMDPSDDFKSAVALFEAYKNLTPLVASLPDLWVYLTHVDLFNYVQQRYSGVFDDKIREDYIIQHWFKNDVSIFRMGLPGLWWSIWLSFDEESFSSIIDDVPDTILFVFAIFNVLIFSGFLKVAELLFISFSFFLSKYSPLLNIPLLALSFCSLIVSSLNL